MNFGQLIPATLRRRYQRFLADVELAGGDLITVHCPNTGAMTGCAEPGRRVWLSVNDSPTRKYPHSWELVETGSGMACIHSARANRVVEEALREGRVGPLAHFTGIDREVKYGERSRADLRLRHEGVQDCFVEVKCVTLCRDGGVGLFPDAVSARARRHRRGPAGRAGCRRGGHGLGDSYFPGGNHPAPGTAGSGLSMRLGPMQLTGRSDDHLVYREGIGLQAECWLALEALRGRAAREGFDLQVASGFRSFDRQLAIWNGKARGERPVHDDRCRPVDLDSLSPAGRVEAILRYSALPGASRHHWGTDVDIFDAAALPPGYRLQLTPEEVSDEGLMGAFHRWLDEELAAGNDFFRPYAVDRGGVAVERWHLSFAPLARGCEAALTPELLADALCDCELELADVVLEALPQLFKRYICSPRGEKP